MSSKYEPPLDYPAPIQVERYARNGFPVTSGLNYFAGKSFQHTLAYRRKALFVFSNNLLETRTGSPPTQHTGHFAPSTGSETWWRTYVHTGVGASQVKIFMILQGSHFSGSQDVRVIWDVAGASDPGGQVVTLRSGRRAVYLGVDPAAWELREAVLDVEEDTYYQFTMRAFDGVRPYCVAIFELANASLTRSNPGVPNLDDEYRSPILDSRWEETQRAGVKLWKRNAAPVFSWTKQSGDDDAFTNSTATWTNALDSTTSVASTSVGFEYNLDNMGTIRADGVPCRFAVFAKTADSANTAEVRLQNSSGTVVSITGIDSVVGAWYVKDFLLTTTDDKVDLQARNASTTETTLYAATLLQICHEITYPDRVDQWDNEFVGIGRRPQGLWPCQGDGTGSILLDTMGNQPLDEAGTASTITYQVTPTVADPYRTYAVQIDDGGYFEAGDAAFMDAADEVSGAVRLYIPASPGADVGILNKIDTSSSAGYYLYCESTNGNISLVTHDGTSSVTSTVAEDFRGRWVDIIWAIDIANTVQRLWAKGVIAGSTTVKGSDSDSIAALGSLNNAQKFSLGGGGGTGIPTAQSQLYTWACAHDAYALTDTDRDILNATDFVSQEGRILP